MISPEYIQVDGTAVAIDGAAILLLGSSGSGKSDLALRLIDDGALLISDDIVELRYFNNQIHAIYPHAANQKLKNHIEVRGLGILPVAAISEPTPLVLAIKLIDIAFLGRLPDWQAINFFDRQVPLISLAPLAASASAKVRLALRTLSAHIMPQS